MMLFGEKYPDPVRMVSMGEFSKELCGGTHLTNTSQVGQFEVIAEESVSAGTRRVVALTGARAVKHREEVQSALAAAAKTLGCAPQAVAEQVRALVQNVRALKKQLGGGGAAQTAAPSTKKPSGAAEYATQRAILRDAARLLNVSLTEVLPRITAMQDEQNKLAAQVGAMASSSDVSADSLLELAQTVGGAQVIVTETPGATPNLMRQWIDQVRKKSTTPVAVLLATSTGDDKVMLVAGLSQALVDKGLSAGNWISEVAPVVGGGGGGKADLAQAGGKLPAKIPQAIEAAKSSIAQMLAMPKLV
jgi:alanyl-tRNA synthetase